LARAIGGRRTCRLVGAKLVIAEDEVGVAIVQMSEHEIVAISGPLVLHFEPGLRG
jgi:hypothetical protein